MMILLVSTALPARGSQSTSVRASRASWQGAAFGVLGLGPGGACCVLPPRQGCCSGKSSAGRRTALPGPQEASRAVGAEGGLGAAEEGAESCHPC